jgi:hypothetical protein
MKILLIPNLHPHSVSGITTNSSSTLFIIKYKGNQDKKHLRELCEEAYRKHCKENPPSKDDIDEYGGHPPFKKIATIGTFAKNPSDWQNILGSLDVFNMDYTVKSPWRSFCEHIFKKYRTFFKNQPQCENLDALLGFPILSYDDDAPAFLDLPVPSPKKEKEPQTFNDLWWEWKIKKWFKTTDGKRSWDHIKNKWFIKSTTDNSIPYQVLDDIEFITEAKRVYMG